MKFEISLPCSLKPAIGFYPEADEYSQDLPVFYT
jgi:hypothetical protein